MNKQGQDITLHPETPFAPSVAPAPQPAIIKQPYEAYQLSQKAKRFLQLRVKFPDPAEYFPNALITKMGYYEHSCHEPPQRKHEENGYSGYKDRQF